MLRTTLSIFAACLLASFSTAQTTSNTLPIGVDATEGNATFFHWGGSSGRALTGVGPLSRARVITQIGFRRDGSPSGAARMLDVKVTMSIANMNFLIVDADKVHGANKSVVFDKKAVSFPDWTQSAGSPAPFDFVLKLTRPFPYARGDFAWTVEYTNATQTGSARVDREYTGARTGTGAIVSGTGCGSYTHAMRVENNGSVLANNGMRMRLSASGAPASAPTWLLLDFKVSNVPVPGLCSPLAALPTVFLPILPTDASGDIQTFYVGWPYIAGLENTQFCTQLLSFDASQQGLPFSLSAARQATMPTNATTTSKNACYFWSSLPTRTTNFCFYGGAVIAELK